MPATPFTTWATSATPSGSWGTQTRAGRAKPTRPGWPGCAPRLAWGRGDLETCRTSAEEALKYARVAGDPGAEASAWVANAMLAAFDGDRDLNLHCYERALVLAEEAGDLQTLERTWNNLGSRSLDEGRSTEALQHLQRGLEVNERTGHLSGLAILRHNVSEALLGARPSRRGAGRVRHRPRPVDLAGGPSASVSWQLRGDVQLARGNATQAAMALRARRAARGQREQRAVPRQSPGR